MAFNTVEISEYSGRPLEFYKFTAGGTTYRYTSGPVDVTLSTGTPAIDGDYLADKLSLSPVKHARDSNSLEVQINTRRDFPIAQLFRGWVPDTEMPIVIYRKHHGDSEVVAWFSGTVRACDWQESQAQLICEPRIAKMKRLGLRMKHQPTCNLQLYSTRCGVDKDDFKHSVTVTNIDGLVITVSGLPALAADYFEAGYAEMADGSRRSITVQDGNDMTLLLDFEDLAVTDTIDLYAGCKRDHETCRDKFFAAGDSGNPDGNIGNFLGVFTTPTRNIFREGGLTGAGASGFASLPD